MIAHRRGGDVVFHPRFLDLAGHYGFRPRASANEHWQFDHIIEASVLDLNDRSTSDIAAG